VYINILAPEMKLLKISYAEMAAITLVAKYRKGKKLQLLADKLCGKILWHLDDSMQYFYSYNKTN
jgi:hypothetical protein